MVVCHLLCAAVFLLYTFCLIDVLLVQIVIRLVSLLLRGSKSAWRTLIASVFRIGSRLIYREFGVIFHLFTQVGRRSLLFWLMLSFCLFSSVFVDAFLIFLWMLGVYLLLLFFFYYLCSYLGGSFENGFQ